MADYYKKFESGSTTGDLIVDSNMKDIIPDVDLTDTAAVLAAGYVEFNYELKPTPDSNYLKEWTAGSDTEVSSGVWKNNWSLTDRTMTEAERADAILTCSYRPLCFRRYRIYVK